MVQKKPCFTAANLVATLEIEHCKDRGSNLIMQEFGVKNLRSGEVGRFIYQNSDPSYCISQ